MQRAIRHARHAGSWYDDDGKVLKDKLTSFLDTASGTRGPVRAVIEPHAGYSYSGRAAAYGFKCIDTTNIKRVFVLGPSHHWYTKRCAISGATEYETPLGNLPIDQQIYDELRSTGMFDVMTIDVDEAEHSMEMEMPYVRLIFADREDVKIVPIMVGSLSTDSEAQYGRVLGGYLDDPANLFVVSSDFCHWGRRFNYMPFAREPEIFRAIEAMDREGMSLVEQQDPAAFAAYLKRTDNTICGRHPIGVLLNALQNCETKFSVKFVRYEQSSAVRGNADSSVSYATALVQPAAA